MDPRPVLPSRGLISLLFYGSHEPAEEEGGGGGMGHVWLLPPPACKATKARSHFTGIWEGEGGSG